MDNSMQEMQMQMQITMMNTVMKGCFKDCVHSFDSPDYTSQEEQCVKNCGQQTGKLFEAMGEATQKFSGQM